MIQVPFYIFRQKKQEIYEEIERITETNSTHQKEMQTSFGCSLVRNPDEVWAWLVNQKKRQQGYFNQALKL